MDLRTEPLHARMMGWAIHLRHAELRSPVATCAAWPQGGGIPQGGELSLAYGPLMPNISLAMNFGFVVEGNPNDGLPPELLAGVSGRMSPSSLLRALGEQGLLEGASSGELGRIAAVCRSVSGQFMPRMADIQSQPVGVRTCLTTCMPGHCCRHPCGHA